MYSNEIFFIALYYDKTPNKEREKHLLLLCFSQKKLPFSKIFISNININVKFHCYFFLRKTPFTVINSKRCFLTAKGVFLKKNYLSPKYL